MKKDFLVYGILLNFLLLVFFASCENADPGPQQLQGSWKLVTAESDVEIKGQQAKKETVEVAEANLIFNFNTDGTFTYTSSLSVGVIALENQTKTAGKYRIEGNQLFLEFYDAEMDAKAEVSFTIAEVSGSTMLLLSGKEHFVKAIDTMSSSMDAFSKAIMQTFKDNIVRYDLKYSFEKV